MVISPGLQSKILINSQFGPIHLNALVTLKKILIMFCQYIYKKSADFFCIKRQKLKVKRKKKIINQCVKKRTQAKHGTPPAHNMCNSHFMLKFVNLKSETCHNFLLNIRRKSSHIFTQLLVNVSLFIVFLHYMRECLDFFFLNYF